MCKAVEVGYIQVEESLMNIFDHRGLLPGAYAENWDSNCN